MIRITDVVKDFDGFRALNHLNMHVPKGAIYGLVGPTEPESPRSFVILPVCISRIRAR